jgi:hypothetical protein
LEDGLDSVLLEVAEEIGDGHAWLQRDDVEVTDNHLEW